MAACRNSSENVGKMSLKLVFNKDSPRAHTELELDVLSVHGKLVKYVVHLSKRKKLIFFFPSHKLPKQQSTSFWFEGISWVNQTKESVSFRCGYLIGIREKVPAFQQLAMSPSIKNFLNGGECSTRTPVSYESESTPCFPRPRSIV
jgi:hypothetical protein